MTNESLRSDEEAKEKEFDERMSKPRVATTFDKHFTDCHYGRCGKCGEMDGISNKRLWCFKCEKSYR